MHPRLPRIPSAACVALVLALAGAPAAGAQSAPDLSTAVPLSNETTITRWAGPAFLARITALPTPTSRYIARTRYYTEDDFPEVYVVLTSWRDPDGELWYRIRVPGRPNGRLGWVRAEAMEYLRLVRTRLVINRRLLSASLYRSGRRIWFSRIGVGKFSTPTPPGRFWIRERIKVNPETGLYGPWAFGTSAYAPRLTDWPGGGVIGIHGTNQPQLIPGRPSHGCIRVPNFAIRRLAALLPIGTPVLII